MFFQSVDLTTAHRPQLLSDETLLFVQDSVGLYEGKYKLPAYQHGYVYLTSHRICYVDNEEPRKHAVAIELKEIERYEIAGGFLKSSPKVILHARSPDRLAVRGRAALGDPSPGGSGPASPAPANGGRDSPRLPARATAQPPAAVVTWVCPICSLANELPRGFDPRLATEHTALPPCPACGIRPPLALLLKAAIAGAAAPRHGTPPAPAPARSADAALVPPPRDAVDGPAVACPRCTFQNHPSLPACEMCGAPLVSLAELQLTPQPDSPGPALDQSNPVTEDTPESVKVSFRAGGEKVFYERLKGAIVQRKWLLPSAPPTPLPNRAGGHGADADSPSHSGRATPDARAVGIAGLERLGHERRRNNETVISTAFEDLEALMASAKEIRELAQSFAAAAPGTSAQGLLEESAALAGMAPTRDLMTASGGRDALYLNELARNLAEYLTDDRRSVLKREGGIMSLADLWAQFNRARHGLELVSAAEFEQAARQWEALRLPVRLRAFKNGLLVVQPADWTDDKTIAMLLAWLQEFRLAAPPHAVPWDWRHFGRGVTAQEAAARFGWSVGVATEELEMAEEKGILCREESIEGLKFWENWILDGEDDTME